MGNDAHCAAWIARNGDSPSGESRAGGAVAARDGGELRRDGARRTRRLHAVRQARTVRARARRCSTPRGRLGVDLDSVCGGRGICGRCQVEVDEGEHAKHGDHVDGVAPHAGVSEVERDVRGRSRARGRGAAWAAPRASRRRRHRRPAREPALPPGRAQGGRRASDRGRPGRAALLRRGRGAELESRRRSTCDALREALAAEWELDELDADPAVLAGPPARASAREPARHGRGARRLDDHGSLARAPRPRVRHRVRRRLDDRRGPPVRPAQRRGARVRRRDEPADPLRRGPHEPRLLRHAQPRLAKGADARRSAAVSRSSPPSSRQRPEIERDGHPRGDARRQPDHAPPPARDRSDPARRRAVRARRRRGASAAPPEISGSRSTGARVSTSCPASPATSAPTRPA